jgi:hypothetical protein
VEVTAMRVDNKPIRPEVLAALSQLPEVTKETGGTANAIRRDGRQLAPKRTGRLRRGISVERVFDRRTRSVSYLVGWSPSAWYGLLVELGTEDTAPKPHLVPAAIKHGAVAARPGDDE